MNARTGQTETPRSAEQSPSTAVVYDSQLGRSKSYRAGQLQIGSWAIGGTFPLVFFAIVSPKDLMGLLPFTLSFIGFGLLMAWAETRLELVVGERGFRYEGLFRKVEAPWISVRGVQMQYSRSGRLLWVTLKDAHWFSGRIAFGGWLNLLAFSTNKRDIYADIRSRLEVAGEGVSGSFASLAARATPPSAPLQADGRLRPSPTAIEAMYVVARRQEAIAANSSRRMIKAVKKAEAEGMPTRFRTLPFIVIGAMVIGFVAVLAVVYPIFFSSSSSSGLHYSSEAAGNAAVSATPLRLLIFGPLAVACLVYGFRQSRKRLVVNEQRFWWTDSGGRTLVVDWTAVTQVVPIPSGLLRWGGVRVEYLDGAGVPQSLEMRGMGFMLLLVVATAADRAHAQGPDSK
jgi:hypothetical protein